MSEHTKEPWWAKENFNTCWYCSSSISAGHNISGTAHYCSKDLSTFDGEEGECAGYSPDENSITLYKTKSLDAERAHAKEVKQQRDELLAALKAYQNAGFGNSTDFRLQGEAYDLSVKAIAKVK